MYTPHRISNFLYPQRDSPTWKRTRPRPCFESATPSRWTVAATATRRRGTSRRSRCSATSTPTIRTLRHSQTPDPGRGERRMVIFIRVVRRHMMKAFLMQPVPNSHSCLSHRRRCGLGASRNSSSSSLRRIASNNSLLQATAGSGRNFSGKKRFGSPISFPNYKRCFFITSWRYTEGEQE